MFNLFNPTAESIAKRELFEAERKLLTAQSAVEYASAIVMYEKARIERLKNYLAGLEESAVAK